MDIVGPPMTRMSVQTVGGTTIISRDVLMQIDTCKLEIRILISTGRISRSSTLFVRGISRGVGIVLFGKLVSRQTLWYSQVQHGGAPASGRVLDTAVNVGSLEFYPRLPAAETHHN